MPEGASGCAEHAVRRVDRRQRDARHRRRQREGQVDRRVDDALAGEAVAHQHPGERTPKTRLKSEAIERRAEADSSSAFQTRGG
jgi:hypothetical protein